MSKPRNWYTYEFKRVNKVLHGGITKTLPVVKENSKIKQTPKDTSKQQVMPKQKKVLETGKKRKGIASLSAGSLLEQ